MQKPLTTVDPYGWNAEMLAARLLRRHHVAILWQEVQDTWRLDYKEAFKKWSGLPDSGLKQKRIIGANTSVFSRFIPKKCLAGEMTEMFTFLFVEADSEGR